MHKDPSIFLHKILELPMAKIKAWWPQLIIDPQFIISIIVIIRDYGGIVFYMLVQCLVSAELSAYLSAPYLVVPFLITTWEIYYGVYIASYIIGHNATESYQVNGVPHALEDLSIKILGKKNWACGYSLIKSYTL